MEEKRNIGNYRMFLLDLKILPILLAAVSLLNIVLSYFGIDLALLSYMGGLSLLPLAFLYRASYTFQFCAYYRVFLHYASLTWILNIIDYYIGIPISDRALFLSYMGITCIFMFIALYYHQKCRRDGTL